MIVSKAHWVVVLVCAVLSPLAVVNSTERPNILLLLADVHDPDQFASSGALRGIKRDMYEGGVRVPMIAVWKGQIQPGTTSAHPAAFYDLMATFAEAAGIEAPADTDGLSILPVLMGGDAASHDHLYWEVQVEREAKNFRQGVRLDDWKGVRYGAGRPIEPYNLKSDLEEVQNVADDHPERIDQIRLSWKPVHSLFPSSPCGGRTPRVNK